MTKETRESRAYYENMVYQLQKALYSMNDELSALKTRIYNTEQELGDIQADYQEHYPLEASEVS